MFAYELEELVYGLAYPFSEAGWNKRLCEDLNSSSSTY